MTKKILTVICFLLAVLPAGVQAQTRDELEKQRQQLRKELEQTESLLNENKAKTKENFVQWKLINEKVNLQDRIIDNLNRDINLLDNNIYSIQRDINRYDRLLDTLKQEYARSMVYAYKNRSNFDFLNFIFSAASFNDAIRRVAYLKSYRNYREMQGQNILRTQELRRKRIEELGGAKEKKNVVLQSKDKEMNALESQQREKDRILAELKKQGKQLNNQYAAKKKQLQKVDKAISAAIAKAVEEAKRKAAEEEKKRLAALKASNKSSNEETKTTTTSTGAPKRPTVTTKSAGSILLNTEEDVKLNDNFVSNRGSLPWPVDKGYPLYHYGRNQLPSQSWIDLTCVTVATDIGSPVKAVFDGVVSKVIFIEDMQVVIIQHGKYFSTYSNLSSANVQAGQAVKRGQVIGKVAANLDGVGALDFYINDERGAQDPERWLRNR